MGYENPCLEFVRKYLEFNYKIGLESESCGQLALTLTLSRRERGLVGVVLI
jgi:hypothetical protein